MSTEAALGLHMRHVTYAGELRLDPHKAQDLHSERIIDCYRLMYVARNGLIHQAQHFWSGFLDDAVSAFKLRMGSNDPRIKVESSSAESLADINVRNTQKLEFSSHYDYLDLVMPVFWQNVFAEDMRYRNGGIIGAHGDKCYTYREEWKEAGIPFARGVALYLLTYTKEMDQPKHKSMEWVMQKYEDYIPFLAAAEDEVLETKYHIYKAGTETGCIRSDVCNKSNTPKP